MPIAPSWIISLKSTSVSVCFRGISRLPSAFVFLRLFKLAHISPIVESTYLNVDSFVIVSFFLRNIIFHSPHSAVLLLTNMLHLCQITPMFWPRDCYFWCDKPCSCNYICTQRFLLLRSCAYLNSLCKFGFQAWIELQKQMSGSGLWFGARDGFRLQNEALLQLCVGM